MRHQYSSRRSVFFTFLIAVSGVILSIGCSDDSLDDTVDFSQDRQYLPIGNVGSYWDYLLDSTLYDNSGATITESVGYERHEVVDVESDSPGDTTYVMILRRRDNLDADWVDDKQYRIEVGLDGNIFTIVDNLIFLNFKFPAMVGRNWDGVLFDANNVTEIIEGELLLTYVNWSHQVIDRPESISVFNNIFSDCVTVEEANSSTLTNLRRSNATYCRGIGLVSLERSILHTQCANVNPDCQSETWVSKAEKGYIMAQSLIDFQIL